jgi:hypothetical protein
MLQNTRAKTEKKYTGVEIIHLFEERKRDVKRMPSLTSVPRVLFPVAQLTPGQAVPNRSISGE